MKTCSCGNIVDPKEAESLGTCEGLHYFNCGECNSTLVLKTPDRPIILTTWKALKIKATIEELEEYLENERKAE